MNSNVRLLPALLFAAAFVLLPLSVKMFAPHWLDATTVLRLNGMLTGALVVFFANRAPKMLVPLDRLDCDPAREQALRRRAAWTLVLGGLGYGIAFAIAPIDIAGTLAICLLAPATLASAAVVARCAWRRGRAS